MAKPKYDLAAGEYRVLSGPGQGGFFGPSHPQDPATVDRPGVDLAVGQWYRRRIAARHMTTTKIVGKKHPKIVTESQDLEATVGLVLGLGGLVLAWEVGTSIAHGLQGVDPLSWAHDVENWVTGKSASPPSSASTVGGRLQLALLEFMDGSPPPVQTSSSTSSKSIGSTGSSQPFIPHFLPFDPIIA